MELSNNQQFTVATALFDEREAGIPREDNTTWVFTVERN
jgi:hypothetical protein